MNHDSKNVSFINNIIHLLQTRFTALPYLRKIFLLIDSYTDQKFFQPILSCVGSLFYTVHFKNSFRSAMLHLLPLKRLRLISIDVSYIS